MYDKNAFGNPDGSRTEITDMMSEFIAFDKKYFSSGVASPDELKTRVIVGAKGSGKTVYLRRMQANLKLNTSRYVNEIEQEVPATDLIVKFGQCFSGTEITEKWMYVWKFAILRAVISHMLKNDEWNSDVSDNDKKRLLEYQDVIYPQYKVPMTIYSEVRNILSHYSTRNLFNEYAEKREWDEVEIIVGKIIRTLPPIYFFVDSVDEEYGHAPMYWLRCQKGLFYRVMRLLRKDTYGNKLHVIICIRDNVMASICESEHHTRYVNEEHVKLLNWNYMTIQYFFEKKIANLNDCYFINEGQEKTIFNWLNIKMNGKEKFQNYTQDQLRTVGQHYGLPTRLLDWTFSLYIAAFFAFSDMDDTSKNVAIWVLDKNHEIWNAGYGVTIETAKVEENDRQRYQYGIFTLNKSPSKTIEDYIETCAKEYSVNSALHKVIIPIEEQKVVLSDLEMMGINSFNLFRGMEGCAKAAVLREFMR